MPIHLNIIINPLLVNNVFLLREPRFYIVCKALIFAFIKNLDSHVASTFNPLHCYFG